MAGIRPLGPGERFGLGLQRTVGWVLAPVTTLAVHWFLSVRLGLSLADPGELRRSYRELAANRDTPLLLCAESISVR